MELDRRQRLLLFGNLHRRALLAAAFVLLAALGVFAVRLSSSSPVVPAGSTSSSPETVPATRPAPSGTLTARFCLALTDPGYAATLDENSWRDTPDTVEQAVRAWALSPRRATWVPDDVIAFAAAHCSLPAARLTQLRDLSPFPPARREVHRDLYLSRLAPLFTQIAALPDAKRPAAIEQAVLSTRQDLLDQGLWVFPNRIETDRVRLDVSVVSVVTAGRYAMCMTINASPQPPGPPVWLVGYVPGACPAG